METCCWREPAEEVHQAESLLPCHLCYVCGLEIARGHTRWLHLLCPACKDRA